MKKTVVVIAAALMLAGCAQLFKVQDKSAEQIAKGIAEYCKNTDEQFRANLRASINEKAAPHSIAVTCG